MIGTLSSKDRRSRSGMTDNAISPLLDNKVEIKLEYSFWRWIMSDVEGDDGSGFERR